MYADGREYMIQYKAALYKELMPKKKFKDTKNFNNFLNCVDMSALIRVDRILFSDGSMYVFATAKPTSKWYAFKGKAVIQDDYGLIQTIA